MPTSRSHVLRRAAVDEPPVAVRAAGSTIWDAEGRPYLDAAGGAIVVNVGHGRREIAEAMAAQAGAVAYAHGSAFTSEAVERYAAGLAPRLPLDDARIYPVSGGSEAIESALKLVRAYHLARGEPDRWIVFGRWGSYHGNTLGALDLSGRRPLRRPYEQWLGRFRHVSAAYPYRAGEPRANALGTADELAGELERAIEQAGPGTVAAFVAEPIVGATLGAVAPPDDYWPAIADVCRRHGVLLVADEVMTGFGRTGRWFAVDHWGVRPDLLVAAKGATSGYWPFGFVAAPGEIADVVRSAGPFVHGFTYSHHPVGAAVANEVLTILERESLVEASATKGGRLLGLLRDRLAGEPHVGEVRGRGLMVGIELVEDLESRAPFPRSERVAERVLAAAWEAGLLLYSGTGNADGVDGDVLLLGPPFVVTDEELVEIADGTARAIEAVVGVVTAR
ncbi:MAG TPA: aminotransferase class III-fold pyridoxal phosphate-dependent enzyme [Candidatus Limnocylindrales bacterium]|nr:aminotransferase class III-fold pyridoxal phosphate-dependent enzyme [Candidatus Limnocylindrales bacterium]